ncbi:MAG: hypothetical protein CMP76_08895 [Flavobacterium sp.]|uniref:DUF1573 domain-containing protein n=1 Tax=unclassified Flavobacterium TaxID=196869 RepID=UPI000C6B8ECB|nr:MULTISPECIES: DUF1573 domain-containing protein [unclassified Flavobacterium]MBF03398.1 hypothetical protein [Flavobacterium sp.]MCO6161965.1 DUF1573 domain-containing protein [Flavobacterium sp. NRK F7]
MKTLKLSIVALFITSLSFAQAVEAKKVVTKAPNTVAAPAQTKASAMKWNTETHEFGEIEKGKPVSYEFTFTNTTKETILITNVKPSCGCTAANYTKTPIKPGEKGSITATYNAASPGNFTKTVTVTTSEEGAAPKVLIIKGSVKAEEKKEEKSVMFK